MDFDLFEKLSVDEARKFLVNFLNEASKGFVDMQSEMELSGIAIDYKKESFLTVFEWIITKLKTFPEKEDESIPLWIRETDSYRKGLYSFDEASRILILRFAYYMGECFIRNYKGLEWAIGKKKTMQQNMPVVTGFKSNMEMAVFVVCKNMFSKAIEDKNTESAESAIRTWSSFVS